MRRFHVHIFRAVAVFMVGVFVLVDVLGVSAFEATSTNFEIHGSAIESISGRSTSTNFTTQSAGGQTATGISSSSTQSVYSGILYWLMGYFTPRFTQSRYRWRNDNGDENGATWAAPENTAYVNLPQASTTRLRFEVSNEGWTRNLPQPFRLEYAQTSTCATGVYTPVDDSPSNNTSGMTPSTVANDSAIGDTAWNSPSNAAIADSLYATTTLSASGLSYYLKATDFGFAIPTTSTVTGVIVTITKRQSGAGNIFDSEVRLVKGGNPFGLNKAQNDWPGVDSNVTYGDTNDTWGASLTAADVNSSNFGVVIGAKESGGGSATAFVDQISISVYYDTGSAHWFMSASPYVADATVTTNVAGGLADDNITFVASQVKTAANVTNHVDLTSKDFTEMEYAIISGANIVLGANYCFRVADDGDVTSYVYSQYAQASVASVGLPVSGTMTSAILDTNATSGAAFNSILWKGSLNGGTGRVRFQLATSNSTSGPWTFYASSDGGVTCDGSGSTWYTTTGPDAPAEITCNAKIHNNQRYFKYKMQICSNDCSSSGLISPAVDDVVISWSP